MTLTVNPSSHTPPYAPRFRESNAACIEAPRAGGQYRFSPLSPYLAMGRLAQINYFAQSIAQALPAARSAYSHPPLSGAAGSRVDRSI